MAELDDSRRLYVVCFVCRKPTTSHVVKGLTSQHGPGGWARICVTCAIWHDLDGVLLAAPSDEPLAELWYTHQKRKNSETDREIPPTIY